MKKKFEYLVYPLPIKDMSKTLDRLGKKSWELVQVLLIPVYNDVVILHAYFKREID